MAVIGTMRHYRRQGVTVEYTDSRSGRRATKSFLSSPAAKKFYVSMALAGADPCIKTVTQD